MGFHSSGGHLSLARSIIMYLCLSWSGTVIHLRNILSNTTSAVCICMPYVCCVSDKMVYAQRKLTNRKFGSIIYWKIEQRSLEFHIKNLLNVD